MSFDWGTRRAPPSPRAAAMDLQRVSPEPMAHEDNDDSTVVLPTPTRSAAGNSRPELDATSEDEGKKMARAFFDAWDGGDRNNGSPVRPGMLLPVEAPPTDVDDNSTVFTVINTPPETVTDGPRAENDNSATSPPIPGSTFIIRLVSSGRVITLQDGKVILAPPGNMRGSIRWECFENDGWLGFRNTVSGNLLGHDKFGFLACQARRHQRFEYFCARATPNNQGYNLLLTHFHKLWPVGFKDTRLAKFDGKATDGFVWEFIKVP